jgi:Xaa-Pro dipeptidase
MSGREDHVITRRQFLRQTALTSAAAAAPPAAAQDDRRPALPPSIAALTSMRARAQPIGADERRRRLEHARRLMAAQKLDAVLLTGGTTLTYFTGARWGNSERLMALVLPARGEPFSVVPAFEEDRVREQLAAGPLDDVDLRLWQEDESPFARVAQALRDRGIGTGRLGLEETVKFVYSDGIAAAAPGLRLTTATPITAGCRMIKDAHEIALIRLAGEATLACYEAVFRALAPGMTEAEVRALVAAAYARLGFSGGASVQVGEYTSSPHGSVTPQTIREGTIIMLDDGCVAEGYQSDITRTFVLGTATPKMKRVFAVVQEAQATALAAARPGVPLESIDAAARRVITDAGFGPGFKYFTHRLGHGLGMDMHEWPYLAKHNMFGWERSLAARPGMTFSNEPGIYIRGEFGVRLEDDMVITEAGAELLTPPSTSIERPFSS